ncbi:clathrin light chain [Nematostella vectensis]|uniref:clathrin light chain n=1 Tax=Nematostella vectensis TaxID=45351 RepID=UPI0020779AE0|nr:clathrin light chain [Nematostella vectensis]UTO68570.1 clathrin heavy chain [Nematostella vectensis]
MADLLGDDTFSDEQAVDPAAEFLAREQDDLAELGEDLGGPNSDVEGVGFDMSGGEEPVMNGFEDEGESSVSQQTAPTPVTREVEHESVRKWREEKAAQLEKMDEEEKAEIEEWREQAHKELNDWYDRRNEQLGKTKNSNRADEESFVAERDDTSTPGTEWEKVCRACDFNPKATKNTKDVSRMRSIFLQLKQNPLVRD